MKTLLLLRHAKSSWDDSSIEDLKRPLNKRGKKEAPIMGKYLKNKKSIPDLIISSTAKRAQDTSKLIAKSCGYKHDIQYSEQLYSSNTQDYLKVLGEIADKRNMILLVGHNPILEEFLEEITGEQRALKTCSLVNISLPIKSWNEVKGNINRKGKLLDIVEAKNLDKDNS